MRIAVLRGGPSQHYESSLKTGEHVLSILREMPEKYQPVDVFIGRDGDWHIMGRRLEPHRALAQADLVWNALQGRYGEDGEVSRLLANMRMPHTGSGTLGLKVAFNKDLAKAIYEKNGLLTPKHEVVSNGATIEDLLLIFRTYLHPVMVKPVEGRSSLGVSRAHSFEELKESVALGFKHAERVIVEEFIRGKEVACAVLEKFRNQKLYALIPSGSLKPSANKQVESMARKAHEALGLKQYSSSDFIITPKGKIYILETNALPDFHKESSLTGALASVGLSPREFVEHIISTAA